MSNTPTPPQAHESETIADLARGYVGTVHSSVNRIRSKLRLLFAAKRVEHIQNGAGEMEIGIYDNLCSKVIDAVVVGHLKLRVDFNVRLNDSVDGPHDDIASANKAFDQVLKNVGGLLVSDGFEAAYIWMPGKTHSIQSQPDGTITVESGEADIVIFEIHLELGRSYSPPFVDGLQAKPNAQEP